MLIVDDMTAAPRWDTDQHAKQQQVRRHEEDGEPHPPAVVGRRHRVP